MLTKAQRQYNGAKIVFAVHGGAGETGDLHTKMNPDTDLAPFTKIRIIGLNGNCKSTRLLGGNLDELGAGEEFLDTTPKAQSMKEIIDQLNFIKMNNFCSVQTTAKKRK